MEEEELFNKIMKAKKEHLASFLTGYYIEQDEASIKTMLKIINT